MDLFVLFLCFSIRQHIYILYYYFAKPPHQSKQNFLPRLFENYFNVPIVIAPNWHPGLVLRVCLVFFFFHFPHIIIQYLAVSSPSSNTSWITMQPVFPSKHFWWCFSCFFRIFFFFFKTSYSVIILKYCFIVIILRTYMF